MITVVPAPDLCSYSCSPGGGCSVKYTGPPRSGSTSGSCFSAAFGGSCSGIPAECLECKNVIECNEEDIFPKNQFHPSTEVKAEQIGVVGNMSASSILVSLDLKFLGSNPCMYSCTDSGGCTVQYTGPPRGGATSGSCFPVSFGGSCSGTPQECEDCNKAISCEEKDATIGESKLDNVVKKPENCMYNCTDGGGCTVQYKGPPRGGPTFGSCFSSTFGGSCSGTPPECKKCKDALKCSEGEDDFFEDNDNNQNPDGDGGSKPFFPGITSGK